MERFEFASSARASRPRTAQIQISPAESNRIQIYSAKLILVAQFEGIRYPPLFLNLYVDRESDECVDGSCIHIA
jgi:Putative adipose-regulatory protein (Seipin)